MNKLRDSKSTTPYSYVQKNEDNEVEFYGFDEELAETGNTSKNTARRTKLSRKKILGEPDSKSIKEKDQMIKQL